jgi:chromosome segregation ATPase
MSDKKPTIAEIEEAMDKASGKLVTMAPDGSVTILDDLGFGKLEQSIEDRMADLRVAEAKIAELECQLQASAETNARMAREIEELERQLAEARKWQAGSAAAMKEAKDAS